MEQRRFDPYRKWLGIPEGQRPPTHYQLLGISPDEQDRDVINAAMVRHSAYVRTLQVGRYSEEATQLLNELAAAKICLLDPVKRAKYDAELHEAVPDFGDLFAPLQPPERHSEPVLGTGVATVDIGPQFPVARPEASDLPRPRPKQDLLQANILTRPLEAIDVRSAEETESRTSMIWIGLTLLGLAVPIALLVVVLTDKPRRASDTVAAVPPLSVTTGTVSVPQEAPSSVTVSIVQEPPSSPWEPDEAVPPVTSRGNAVPPPIPELADTGNENNPDAMGNKSPFRPHSSTFSLSPQEMEQETRSRAANYFHRMLHEAKNKDERDAVWKEHMDYITGKRPFGEPLLGEDTFFVGNKGGSPRRIVQAGSYLCGVECKLGEFGEKCLSDIEPLFSRETATRLPLVAVARDGYAVGAARINTYTYVDALQLVFMRIKPDGQLDPDDSYTSDWLGVRGAGNTYVLTGNGMPVIGIYSRTGLILDALALVIDTKSKPSSDSQ
ncbi:MAG TPA: hypothetical protein VFI31_04085 [Pirellulales bacterium]|nr:hypothetical protein [Pirellulales bacterium]